MKKVLIIVVAVCAMYSMATAQTPDKVSLYFGGLVSLPSSPEAFADFYKTGFHGSAGVGYKWMPNLQIVGKLEYHRFAVDFDSDPQFTGEDIGGGHNNVWMYGADARYSFGVPAAPMKPFILGGLGFASVSYADYDGTSTLATSLNSAQIESQTKIYFNIGGGVDMKAGPTWSVFGQLRYVSVQTEGDASAFIPITLGIKFF